MPTDTGSKFRFSSTFRSVHIPEELLCRSPSAFVNCVSNNKKKNEIDDTAFFAFHSSSALRVTVTFSGTRFCIAGFYRKLKTFCQTQSSIRQSLCRKVSCHNMTHRTPTSTAADFQPWESEMLLAKVCGCAPKPNRTAASRIFSSRR